MGGPTRSRIRLGAVVPGVLSPASAVAAGGGRRLVFPLTQTPIFCRRRVCRAGVRPDETQSNFGGIVPRRRRSRCLDDFALFILCNVTMAAKPPRQRRLFFCRPTGYSESLDYRAAGKPHGSFSS